MKILVTGGAGFIGSTVVDEYIKAGHKVVVLDNLSSGRKNLLNQKAKFTKGSVTDESGLKRLFKKYRFDVINHHAAQIDVRKSVENPFFDEKTNIQGTLNLLSMGRDYKIKKFIFSASGGTAYGECRRPAKEGDPEIPSSPYGVSKLAGEKYIQCFSQLYGFKHTIFRYANVYGPRQDPHGEAGVVAIFSIKLLENKVVTIFGNGRQTRDFVFSKDVAKANRLALTQGHNQIINIGTGKETSVIGLYKEMGQILNHSKKPLFKSSRPGELNRSFLNFQRANRHLGWHPETSIRKGLAETIAYFAKEKGFNR